MIFGLIFELAVFPDVGKIINFCDDFGICTKCFKCCELLGLII